MNTVAGSVTGVLCPPLPLIDDIREGHSISASETRDSAHHVSHTHGPPVRRMFTARAAKLY